jgi:hypothetical protein
MVVPLTEFISAIGTTDILTGGFIPWEWEEE